MNHRPSVAWIAILWSSTASVSAQVVSGSLTTAPLRTDSRYDHRATFGVRYEPCVRRWCLQLGGVIQADHALFAARSGSTLVHWGAGLSYPLLPEGGKLEWSAGRFVRQGFEHDSPRLPRVRYYRFWALGARWQRGPWDLVAEQMVAVPQQVQTGIKDGVLRLGWHRARWRLAGTLTHTRRSQDQPPGPSFWSGLLFARYGPVGLYAGTESLPGASTVFRPMEVVGFGLYFP